MSIVPSGGFLIYQCIMIQLNYSWTVKCIILNKIEIWLVGEFSFFPKKQFCDAIFLSMYK